MFIWIARLVNLSFDLDLLDVRRTIGNLDIKLDFVPPSLINFISRQLIGSGFRFYKKVLAAPLFALWFWRIEKSQLAEPVSHNPLISSRIMKWKSDLWLVSSYFERVVNSKGELAEFMLHWIELYYWWSSLVIPISWQVEVFTGVHPPTFVSSHLWNGFHGWTGIKSINNPKLKIDQLFYRICASELLSHYPNPQCDMTRFFMWLSYLFCSFFLQSNSPV